MAYTILTESYGRRLPKITATAESTDDLAALGVEFAEGSTVNVGGTVYSLDKVNGWVVPGSGGGGGAFVVNLTKTGLNNWSTDATVDDIANALDAGLSVIAKADTLGGPSYCSLGAVGKNVMSGEYYSAQFYVPVDDDGDYFIEYFTITEDGVEESLVEIGGAN